jgi:hypothetical protein
MQPVINFKNYLRPLGICLLVTATSGVIYETFQSPIGVGDLAEIETYSRQGIWDYFAVVGLHLLAVTAAVSLLKRSKYATLSLAILAFSGIEMLLLHSWGYTRTPLSTVSLLSIVASMTAAILALVIGVGERPSAKKFFQLVFGMCLSLTINSMF